MKISKTNKIIITAGAFFIIFTIIVGSGLKPKENTSLKEIELISDYEITEQDSQRIIMSNEAGFSMSLPADWIVDDFEREISFFNSEIKIKPGKTVTESMEEDNICYGTLKVKKYTNLNHNDITSLSELIHRVETGELGQEGDYAFTLSSQTGINFLKTTFFKGGQPIYISLKAINDNKIYYISFGPFSSQECAQQFNIIFESVKIN